MSLPNPGDVPDEWDFYPCRVDDRAASLALNLWFRREAPFSQAPFLYWVFIFMDDSDKHGMGSAAEADVLFPITDEIVAAAVAKGLYQVGRLRNNGCWQLTFYGAPGLEQPLEAIAAETISGREFEVGCKPDSEWDYYLDFLCPDAERWQWIMDRRVIEALEAKGNVASFPRPVDHCLYFPSVAERDRFLDAARAKGFEVSSEFEHEESTARPFGVELKRVDPVELDHIHDIVMDLTALAHDHKGDYDGWGTTVERGD